MQRRNPYRQAAWMLCLSLAILAAVGWIALLLTPEPTPEQRRCLGMPANEFYKCMWELRQGGRS